MPDESALEKLKKQIREAKKAVRPLPANENKSPAFHGRWFSAGTDLVAGVFVGVGLGLLVDWLFNCSPWGLIGFFLLGSVAGLRNVYRVVTTQENQKNKEKR